MHLTAWGAYGTQAATRSIRKNNSLPLARVKVRAIYHPLKPNLQSRYSLGFTAAYRFSPAQRYNRAKYLVE